MPNEPQSLGDIFAEEEDRLAAEANTPERIAADQALADRTRIKSEREMESLRAQGMIVEEGEEPTDDDDDEDAEPEKVPCGQCEGSGTITGGLSGDGPDETCPVCDGEGEIDACA